MLKDDLLKLIVCPNCRGELLYHREQERLICPKDKVQYVIEKGVPNLIYAESEPLSPEGNHYE